MSNQQYKASYADGQSARVSDITVSFDELATGSNLNLHNAQGIFARWRFSDLRQLRDQTHVDGLVLFDVDNEIARLTITDPGAIKFIKERAPNLRKRAPIGAAMRKALAWALAAIASVLLIVFVVIPALSNQLATLVPVERERQMGQAVIGQIRWGLARFGGSHIPVCANEPGQAALDKMAARLLGDVETPHPFQISVFDHGMVNAFAVPGGQIVLFRGLLEKAETPEEVAGVLAHEAGHVVHRDPLRLALRSSGTAGLLGLVLGDFTGGAFVLILTEQLIASSYSQAAEKDADIFAVDLLNRAGLPSGPFADFFLRLIEEYEISDENWTSHLSTHPHPEGRAKEARQGGTHQGAFEPILTSSEWADLRSMCDVHGPLPKDPKEN